MRYEVNAGIFEGPLSLLIELAKLQLLDVFIIKLHALTAQYLELVKTSRTSLNELAEPLPLLGQLVAMKARLLLPQPPPLQEDETPMSLEELERRLREYEQFKTVAQVLAELHALQRDHFVRSQSEELSEPADRGVGSAQPPLEVGIVDLMTAFARVLEKAHASIYEVQTEPWTVEMKVEELGMVIAVRGQVPFEEVFAPQKSRLELVVTFLALLELVRRRVCRAIQEHVFGDILIVRVPLGQ